MDLVAPSREPGRVRPRRAADVDQTRRWPGQDPRQDLLRALELETGRAEPETRLLRKPGVVRQHLGGWCGRAIPAHPESGAFPGRRLEDHQPVERRERRLLVAHPDPGLFEAERE